MTAVTSRDVYCLIAGAALGALVLAYLQCAGVIK